jgi:hypothetical protein
MEPTLVEHNGSGLESESSNEILEFFRKNEGPKLSEAIRVLSDSTKIKKYEIVKKIYTLNQEGLIHLYDPRPPATLRSYLFSSYSAWFWALSALVASTIITVYVPLGPFVYIRYLLGSIFVLYIPGSTLIEILYHKKEELSQIERVVLSMGISLTIVPLIALVLSYTPFGVRLDSVLLSLSFLSICLGLGALKRKFTSLRS